MKNYAAIDIGTNTILLTIASFDQGKATVIEDIHNIARLGEGLNNTGCIKEDAIERAKIILGKYRNTIDKHRVSSVYLTGTSALRNASNSGYVKDILEKSIGHEISVISGEEEAKLTLIGSLEKKQNSATLIDIGGGSTEIISGEVGLLNTLKSIPIGVVYLKDKYILNDNYKLLEYNNIKQYIYNIISKYINKPLKYNVIAVSGTPTTLATIYQGLKDFQIEKVHGFVFNKKMIDEITESLKKSTVDDIINKFHVHPGRADVITIGAIILQTFMEIFNIDEFSVSARGLRYGALKKVISYSEKIDISNIDIL